MDLTSFTNAAPGELVTITGTDPQRGEWAHKAFVPHPLPVTTPALSAATYRVVGNCRAALAALDSTARRLPNPRLFRRPALQVEAQSTSALEGTYAPLAEVLIADEERPPSIDVREILNYVNMADTAFNWVEAARPLTVTMVAELQAVLVARTRAENAESGGVRRHQVVIGRRRDAAIDEVPVYAARFVPSPPGIDLRASLQDLLDWMSSDLVSTEIDPVVAAAMGHYQFEELHPLHDGNGRIGRLLIVLQLLKLGVLSEPTLTVSPWFEARRGEYYDYLFAVSATGNWDQYIRFFALGLEASATATHSRMLSLVEIQRDLKDRVRNSHLRADTAQSLVDFAFANMSFTVRQVERALDISYGRANGLVKQLVELGVLEPVASVHTATRRFFAPSVLKTIAGG
jgi:Fic family protein